LFFKSDHDHVQLSDGTFFPSIIFHYNKYPQLQQQYVVRKPSLMTTSLVNCNNNQNNVGGSGKNQQLCFLQEYQEEVVEGEVVKNNGGICITVIKIVKI